MKEKKLLLPILPLKNVILLPKATLPVKVTRSISINAVNQALGLYGGEIFVTFQKESESEALLLDGLNTTGVVARVFESFCEKDNSLKILVEGLYRAKMANPTEFLTGNEAYFIANIEKLDTKVPKKASESVAYIRNLKKTFKEVSTLDGEKVTTSLLKTVNDQKELETLVDIIAVNTTFKEEEKKFILEEADILSRAHKVYTFLKNEIEIAKAEKNIRKRVQSQVEKHQKDYYLNEQVRAIYKELGREDYLLEIEKFKEQGKKLKLSAEANDKLLTECKRLEQMQPASPEAIVSRSYIEWLLAVPWYKKSKDQLSLDAASKILDSSHAGMLKAKETILDFIGAKKFAKEKLKSSPIICLVGPPGVGKTSLAKSIAEALGRTFIRLSLGGLRDEAEIRGHRRTYIGAMPGKLVSSMRKAGVVNPLILLDEIDKMSSDFRGDPASALLEVLDPEQNKNFVDHFLEAGYDLSQVVFIATANLFENIPFPLLDRMEIITLSGYTEEEKINICEKFLLPKLLEEHALLPKQIEISKPIVQKIISEYTREAGVRQLSRNLLKIIRKCIQKIIRLKNFHLNISASDVENWLGYPKFKNNVCYAKESLGVVTGLAWTEAGGDILEIEVVKLKGKGGLTITGQLGEVMQESAQASLSFIRSIAKSMGLKEGFYSSFDLHMHIPEGATPKDGPSAGIAMATALTSILTEIPTNRLVAMTGEITLQGRVLPVGGLKEKLLAAIRFGVKTVLVPNDNKAEVWEIKKEADLSDLEIIFVTTLEEVLKKALKRSPFVNDSETEKSITKKPVIKKPRSVVAAVKAKTKSKSSQRGRQL